METNNSNFYYTIQPNNINNPYDRAVSACERILSLGQPIGLSESELFDIALYIETEFPKMITKDVFYLKHTQSGLARTIEFDPESGCHFIHLKNKSGLETIKTEGKTVTQSVLYDPFNPQIVANIVSKNQRAVSSKALSLLASTVHTHEKSQEPRYQSIYPLHGKASLKDLFSTQQPPSKRKIIDITSSEDEQTTDPKRSKKDVEQPSLPSQERFVKNIVSERLRAIPESTLQKVAEFIETKFPEYIANGAFYVHSQETGLPAAIEYDPKTNTTFIHFTKSLIGKGYSKKATLSAVYDPDKPRPCVRLVLEDRPGNQHSRETVYAGEYERLQKVPSHAPGLVQSLAFTEHTKRKTGQRKQEVIQEFYENGTLSSVVTRTDLSQKQKTKIAYDVMQGLDVLHRELGMVHRDLHSVNIFVDSNYNAVVADLGEAKDTKDVHGIVCQTNGNYVAPEGRAHLSGKAYELTDLYAAGCSLYEVVYRRKPSWLGKPNLTDAINHATAARREELRAKEHARTISPAEQLELGVLALVHPNPEERKSAQHWAKVFNEVLNKLE